VIGGKNMTVCKRIFPATEDIEFKTIEEFGKWLGTICKGKTPGKFHLRSKNGLGDGCNSPGSLWIFRFKGHLIGEGSVEKDITDNDDEQPEKFAICFNPNTIKVYPRPIPVKNISLPSGKDITRRGIILSEKDHGYLKNILRNVNGLI
jgi:hypothetical protein